MSCFDILSVTQRSAHVYANQLLFRFPFVIVHKDVHSVSCTSPIFIFVYLHVSMAGSAQRLITGGKNTLGVRIKEPHFQRSFED